MILCCSFYRKEIVNSKQGTRGKKSKRDPDAMTEERFHNRLDEPYGP
jgi:hypothetical protein